MSVLHEFMKVAKNMMSQKKNKGIGLYQLEHNVEARNAICKVLSDGKWHRIKELKEKTGISPTTLYRKLESLENQYLIERKEAVEKGKYAVLYKAIPEMVTSIRIRQLTKELNQAMEEILIETKDPLFALDTIHLFSQLGVLTVLKILSQLKKKKRKIAWTLVEFFEETLLWFPYKSLTLNLINLNMKMIYDINIKELLSSQAERNKTNNAQKIEEISKKYMIHILKIPENEIKKDAEELKDSNVFKK